MSVRLNIQDISLVVLTGGRNRRMGKVKAFLPYGDTTFLNGILNALGHHCKEIFISVNEDNFSLFHGYTYSRLGNNISFVIDEYKDKGPLSGIYSALKASSTPWSFVVPCDMPLMDGQVLENCLPLSSTNTNLVMLEKEDTLLHLPMLINKNLLEVVKSGFSSGNRSIKYIIPHATIEKRKTEAENLNKFLNINTESDYIEFQKIYV